jgi:uncharacterized membrane protein YraQ (UPF0718 family)
MKGEQKKTGLGGWLFLLLVIAIYGVTAVSDAGIAVRALSVFAKVMQNVLPALVMVFFLLLMADLLFKPEWIKRNLGEEAGIKAWLIAAVAGVLASGPIYAWYALLRDLRAKDLRASLAAVFLYSRAIKLPLLPLMIHYFGTAYTLVVCFYLLGFSVVNGFFMIKLNDCETTSC